MEEKTTRRDYSLFHIPYTLFLVFIALLTLPSCQSGKEAAKPPVRLGADVARLTEEILAPMENPVILRIMHGSDGEAVGEEAQTLVDFIAANSPKVTVERVDMATQPDTFDPMVSHGPIIEMRGQAPGVLRYYGYPERKETRPFLEGILSASGHPAELAPKVESYIAELGEEVLIRIFTTPD
jgi:hypothetical protein